MSKNEHLARDWAIRVKDTMLEHVDDAQRAAVEYILENTTSETMADLVWDDKTHRLGGAVSKTREDYAMIMADGDVGIYAFHAESGEFYWLSRDSLTPNGKRYKLVEVTEPDHPKVLDSREGYVIAPAGTVIAGPDQVFTKGETLWFPAGVDDCLTHSQMAGADSPARRVLRWGDEV